jgi:hypothetical protein
VLDDFGLLERELDDFGFLIRVFLERVLDGADFGLVKVYTFKVDRFK